MLIAQVLAVKKLGPIPHTLFHSVEGDENLLQFLFFSGKFIEVGVRKQLNVVTLKLHVANHLLNGFQEQISLFSKSVEICDDVLVEPVWDSVNSSRPIVHCGEPGS
ncbi:hypothetical protein PG988_006763 [Apiospora saccharicola]